MTRYSNVVVAYDFSHTGREALHRAITLAARAPFHILHVVCVIERHWPIPAFGPGPVDYRYAERVQQALAAEITTELNSAELADRVHFFVHARIGKPADEILAVAREIGADLVMIGTKGLTGVTHIVLGSVAERVVRDAECTVEVVRAKTYPEVDLLQIRDVEATGHYVPPHRYSYEQRQVNLRPNDWPLY